MGGRSRCPHRRRSGGGAGWTRAVSGAVAPTGALGGRQARGRPVSARGTRRAYHCARALCVSAGWARTAHRTGDGGGEVAWGALGARGHATGASPARRAHRHRGRNEACRAGTRRHVYPPPTHTHRKHTHHTPAPPPHARTQTQTSTLRSLVRCTAGTGRALASHCKPPPGNDGSSSWTPVRGEGGGRERRSNSPV
jgi:hypothetical protein